MRSRPLTTLLLLAVVAAASACSAPMTGPPDAAAPARPAAAPPSSPVPETRGEPETAVTAINPCALVGPADLVPFGRYAAPNRKATAGGRACQYVRQGSQAPTDALTVELSVRNGFALAAMPDPGGGLARTTVAGRQAQQGIEPPSDCVIALGVGQRSRLEVWVSSAQRERSCTAAQAIAAIAGPRLPAG